MLVGASEAVYQVLIIKIDRTCQLIHTACAICEHAWNDLGARKLLKLRSTVGSGQCTGAQEPPGPSVLFRRARGGGNESWKCSLAEHELRRLEVLES